MFLILHNGLVLETKTYPYKLVSNEACIENVYYKTYECCGLKVCKMLLRNAPQADKFLALAVFIFICYPSAISGKAVIPYFQKHSLHFQINTQNDFTAFRTLD